MVGVEVGVDRLPTPTLTPTRTPTRTRTYQWREVVRGFINGLGKITGGTDWDSRVSVPLPPVIFPCRGRLCLRFPRQTRSHSGKALEGIRCRSVFFPLITIPKFFCCGGGCGVVINPRRDCPSAACPNACASARRAVHQVRQIHSLRT
jgi:hypothetical protein